MLDCMSVDVDAYSEKKTKNDEDKRELQTQQLKGD